MKKSSTIISASILLASLFISGCGQQDTGITGSECDLIDCSFDELSCMYEDSTPAYKVLYKRVLEDGAGFEYAAIVVINLDGLDSYNDLLVEGEDFTNRVFLYRPGVGEQWPEYDDGKLEISEGGNATGQQLSGKASFRFNNGFFASTYFDCTLEAPLQE